MGCARLVYNRALAARTEAWYERQERVGYSMVEALNLLRLLSSGKTAKYI